MTEILMNNMDKILVNSLIRLLMFACLSVTSLTGGLHADEEQLSESVGEQEVGIPWGDPLKIKRLDHAQAAITINGHLDEPAWATPPLISKLRVIEPDTLAVPPYGTEFRLFYTEQGVYASYKLEQPSESIVKRYTVRDAFGVNRDNVSFTLDTSGEGRYAYWVNLSLGDVQMDGTVKPERQFSREWDGAWHGATQSTANGWTAEFFVPWSQMAMPKVEGTRRIGLYLSRIVAHLDERWAWPPLPQSKPRFMSVLQPLAFEGIDPRKQWSVFPYASAAYDRVDDDIRYKAGMDVFWRPSSNFQLTATVKPDFGAVESDDVDVNLTADETFFPEKRLFFLEGQDIFNTSPRAEAEFGNKLTIVNTRRIGARPREPELPTGVELPRREEVRPTDLLGAAKVTGQVGSIRYGVLAAFEDDSDFRVDEQFFLQDGRDFAALRVLYEDNHNASYRGLGFISTLVSHPEADAIVHGIDFHRLSSTGAWNINGQLLYSDLDEVGTGYGGFFDVDYTQRQGLKHEMQLTAYDDTLDVNDLGFQVRNDTRDFRYAIEWLQSETDWIRNSRVGAWFRYAENGDGFKTNYGTGTNVQITLNNLHNINLDLTILPDKFDDRNSFGNGTFVVESKINSAIEYQTDRSKPFSLALEARRRGEDTGGYAYELESGITWRPRNNITLDAEVSYGERNGWLLHQQDRQFTTFNSEEHAITAGFNYFPSATQQFRIVLQWVGIRAIEDEFFTLEEGGTALIPGSKPPGDAGDFSISELNFQVRYRWQIAPLSDLFIVYTKGDSRETPLHSFGNLFEESWKRPLGEQLIVKLRYRLGS